MGLVHGKDISDAGFKYLGTPYSDMDCQAFIEQCLSDCGIKKNLPGSNSWYREVRQNGLVVTPEECVKMYGLVPAGAFLFIVESDGGEPDKYKDDGLGNASHIGLVTRKGEGAIHSSSKNAMVCESKFKDKTIPNGGWNMVGLWDFVDYGIDFIPDDPDPSEDEDNVNKATVHSENGLPVKMRQSPSTNCRYYNDVPNGAIVDLYNWGEKWSKIGWAGKTGYMMSDFLIRGEVRPGTPTGNPDNNMILVSRTDLEKIYNLLGEMLNTVG